VIEKIEEAIDGMSPDGNYVCTANYISEYGSVGYISNKENVVEMLFPIIENDKPTWEDRFSYDKCMEIKRNAFDWWGEYMCDPAKSSDKFFDIDKIDEELSKLDKDITAKTAVFNSHYTKYVDSIKNFTNPYSWKEMTEEYICKIQDSISQFKEVITSLSTQLIEVSKLEARKKLLFEKLNSFGQINETSSLIQIRIDNLYNKRNELSNSLLSLNTN
jgi:hypothetical protein